MGNGADFWSSLPGQQPEAAGEPTGDLDLVQRYKRFRKYNANRLNLVRFRLSDRCRDVFDVLPLLIHQPTAGLPGGGEEHAAHGGIVNFEPTAAIKNAATRLFPKISFRSWASLHRPAVLSLLAMGSMGTIAQTKKSDLDIWVVVDKRISKGEQWDNLCFSLEEIARWAGSNGLEVHFFPLSIEKIRERDFGRIEGESAGSALKSILIEEFYRTHLLLQGQAPLWWLADPQCDTQHYQSLNAMLSWERRLDLTEFVDLGQPQPIPADEFLGACLWQMVKSLRRPFKSLLKMTLVARHLDQDNPPLLCELLKERILAKDELDPLDTDPYLILVDTLVDEYDRRGESVTGRLLRQSFYLQLLTGDEQVILAADGSSNLRRLAERWGWSASDVLHLERFKSWKIRTINKLGRGIQIYLEGVLDRLRARLQEGTQPAIRREDIDLIDKKIRGARGQNVDQVELMFTGYFPGSLAQQKLLFSRQDDGWAVFCGGDTEALVSGRKELGAVLAWTVVNGLFGKHTSVQVEGHDSPSSSSVRARLLRMAEAFSCVRPEDVPVAAYDQPPQTKFVLVEVFSLPRGAETTGIQQVSENWDLLEYGDDGRCLIERIVVWAVTSWGTVIRRVFLGPTGIAQALVFLLDNQPSADGQNVRFVPGDNSTGGRSASRRFEMLSASANETLGLKSQNTSHLFLLRPKGSYFVISQEASGFVQMGPLDQNELNELLSSPQAKTRRLVVDPASVRLGCIAEGLKRTVPGSESVFVCPEVDGGILFAIDEFGSVFLVSIPNNGVAELLQECAVRLSGIEMSTLTVLTSAADGGWVEQLVDLPMPILDVTVVGDLSHLNKLRFQVRSIEDKLAPNLEEASLWLLSRYPVGLEKTPNLGLGEVELSGHRVSSTDRLRLQHKLALQFRWVFDQQKNKTG